MILSTSNKSRFRMAFSKVILIFCNFKQILFLKFLEPEFNFFQQTLAIFLRRYYLTGMNILKNLKIISYIFFINRKKCVINSLICYITCIIDYCIGIWTIYKEAKFWWQPCKIIFIIGLLINKTYKK